MESVSTTGSLCPGLRRGAGSAGSSSRNFIACPLTETLTNGRKPLA